MQSDMNVVFNSINKCILSECIKVLNSKRREQPKFEHYYYVLSMSKGPSD